MPISIVVGGQYGSEGKGKTALHLAREAVKANERVTVLRVGGSNSGHTGYDRHGRRWTLRQMPAASVDRDVDVVFPDGSYIDPDILMREIESLRYPLERITISPRARIILPEHVAWERDSGLVRRIGSTGSGTGAAVLASTARETPALGLPVRLAEDHAPFKLEGIAGMVRDQTSDLDRKLERDERVIIEGSQGFGLSLAESGHWPKVTARTTTAAGALAEAGLPPTQVDDVVMVLRAFPIRVAGDSGPLANETSWEKIASDAGHRDSLREYTTVTGKLRRVGEFDPLLVKRAISYNAPTRIVINHLDYVPSNKVDSFVSHIEASIGRRISLVGLSPVSLEARNSLVTAP